MGLFARLIALGVGVSGALLSLELALRASADGTVGEGQPTPLAEVELGWTSRPYDALPERDERAGDRWRLLVLGDSFMTPNPRYADGDRDMLWPVHTRRLLPQELRARFAARTLAAPGWGLNQQILAFEQKGASYEPDLVVLCICSNNDLLDITMATDANRAPRPYFQLVDDELRGFDRTGRPIDLGGRAPQEPLAAGASRGSGSALLDRLRQSALDRGWLAESFSSELDRIYRGWSGMQSPESIAALAFPDRIDFAPQLSHDLFNAYVVEPSPWLDYQWALSERMLALLRDRVRAGGAELAVLVLPMTLVPQDPAKLMGSGFRHRFETPEGPITIDLEHPVERFRAICERLGVEFWDVIEGFHAEATEPATFAALFPDDNRHWTWVGHALVAEQVLPRIEEKLRALTK